VRKENSLSNGFFLNDQTSSLLLLKIALRGKFDFRNKIIKKNTKIKEKTKNVFLW